MNFEGQDYRDNLYPFLVKEEGTRSRAYKDQAGRDTIGIGHLIRPDEKRLLSVTLTPKQIEDLFFLDVVRTEDEIKNSIKVPLNANQSAAITSFVFNVGSTAFKSSTLLKLLNEGKYREASLEFPRWKYITLNGRKQVSQGLVQRRLREQVLFNR